MPEDKFGKSNRTLSMYSRLMNGRVLNKSEEAKRFGVSERSIQRDFDEIRMFLDEQAVVDGIPNDLVYDRSINGYLIEQADNLKLSNAEILAVSKILLASRAFTNEEMNSLLDKMVDSCVPKKNQKLVNDLLLNEKFHYIEPRHKREFLDDLWRIGQAIHEQRIIEIKYKGYKGHEVKTRRIEPLAIMFSDYYFYLLGVLENVDHEVFANPDDVNPTIYRIDRLQGMEITSDHFNIPYKDKFEEGEFRKRVQFMQGGPLRKVKFEYTGYSIEAVLDRLPTAKILNEDDGKYVVQAEVYGDGIDMWLRSQGDSVCNII